MAELEISLSTTKVSFLSSRFPYTTIVDNELETLAPFPAHPPSLAGKACLPLPPGLAAEKGISAPPLSPIFSCQTDSSSRRQCARLKLMGGVFFGMGRWVGVPHLSAAPCVQIFHAGLAGFDLGQSTGHHFVRMHHKPPSSPLAYVFSLLGREYTR